MEPEFLEIASHIHFETIATRHGIPMEAYEAHEDWCDTIHYDGGICTCDMQPHDDE